MKISKNTDYAALNICFGYSKDRSRRDRSFEYPQHKFWLRNKKNNFHLHILIWGPEVLYIERVFILYNKTYIVYARMIH